MTRSSKFMAIIAAGCLLVAGGAFAQNQDRAHNKDRDWQKGPPSVEEKLSRISRALDLSDEQVVAMLVVLQEQEANRAELHRQTMDLLGPDICAQRMETEEAILAILTPDQAVTFNQIMEERMEKARERSRRGRGPDSLDCSQYEGG